MERLTIKDPSGLIHLNDNKESTKSKAIKKLSDYEDLEEQGKLMKLPCSVGDTVYSVSFRKHCAVYGELVDSDIECIDCYACDSKKKREKEYFIKEIKATLPTIANLINRPDDFTVFLTREESEAALQKINEREQKK